MFERYNFGNRVIKVVPSVENFRNSNLAFKLVITDTMGNEASVYLLTSGEYYRLAIILTNDLREFIPEEYTETLFTDVEPNKFVRVVSELNSLLK